MYTIFINKKKRQGKASIEGGNNDEGTIVFYPGIGDVMSRWTCAWFPAALVLIDDCCFGLVHITLQLVLPLQSSWWVEMIPCFAGAGVAEPAAKSTVFINDVAFEVAVGPFNVREAFGDDAVLVHSSGHPVLTNEWGVTLQSLHHGGFYYLVRTLTPISSTASENTTHMVQSTSWMFFPILFSICNIYSFRPIVVMLDNTFGIACRFYTIVCIFRLIMFYVIFKTLVTITNWNLLNKICL